MARRPAPLPPPLPSGAAIVAEHAGRAYGGTVVVDGLSLRVGAGTILGVVGPSGCGKTTLVRMLIGLERPTSGRVRVFGTDPADWSVHERSAVGYLPQQPALYPELSMRANLRFYGSLYGLPWRGRRAREQRLLAWVGLLGHERKAVRDASGGMQRRLALAATLQHDPRLVVLDEPTAGIDPILRATVWERLRELRDEGRTVVVTTQVVPEADRCDRVLVMARGRALATDTPDGLRRRAFGGDVVEVTLAEAPTSELVAELWSAPAVRSLDWTDRCHARLVVDDGAAAVPRLLELTTRHGGTADRVQAVTLDLDEAFTRIVRAAEHDDGAGPDPSDDAGAQPTRRDAADRTVDAGTGTDAGTRADAGTRTDAGTVAG